MSSVDLTDSSFTSFFADVMLGKLARWLRILGYDTEYERGISDEMMVQRVLQENRWLLTRDGHVARRKVLRNRHTLIASDHVFDQLQQLARELKIELTVHAQAPSRCPDCNVLLITITPQQAASWVPPFVLSQYEEFTCCSSCGRVFWSGTHWTHLERQLELIRTKLQECG